MKLDDLLHTLAEDDSKPRLPHSARIALAAALGSAASAVLVVSQMGLRPDYSAALTQPYVQIKVGFAILLILTTFHALRVSAQPEPASLKQIAALLVVPAWILSGIAFELVTTPRETWLGAACGKNPLLCLVAIPFLSLAPLVLTLHAMRSAAPASPAKAGVFAGLFSGALGASAYMLRCTDDAPLYVGAWYTLAILLLGAVGGAVGSRLLRW
jgi:hypothetical protein